MLQQPYEVSTLYISIYLSFLYTPKHHETLSPSRKKTDFAGACPNHKKNFSPVLEEVSFAGVWLRFLGLRGPESPIISTGIGSRGWILVEKMARLKGNR